jgi:hypothetical protein
MVSTANPLNDLAGEPKYSEKQAAGDGKPAGRAAVSRRLLRTTTQPVQEAP